MVTADGWHHLVFFAPDSKAGAKLGELIQGLDPDAPGTVLNSDGDVILCYEFSAGT